MPKIWIMSDLHCEFGAPALAPNLQPPADIDLVILAGDYHQAAQAVPHARQHFRETHIIMVAGNHEHYRSHMTIDAGIDQMRAAAQASRDQSRPGSYVLENESVELCLQGQKIRVIGATLWTDFKLFGDYEKSSTVAKSWMNDYLMIRGKNQDILTPRETALRHAESRAYIKGELQRPFNGTTIVVTHHLPAMNSVATRYKIDALTPAFTSDCTELLELGADLWVHGHTHDSCDYIYGGTRVICNPRGYPNPGGSTLQFENSFFDPLKIVEL
jgi:predicted phosphodiesterase